METVKAAVHDIIVANKSQFSLVLKLAYLHHCFQHVKLPPQQLLFVPIIWSSLVQESWYVVRCFLTELAYVYLCTICNGCFFTFTCYLHELPFAHSKLSLLILPWSLVLHCLQTWDLMHNLPDKSDSDDGFLDPKNGPIVYCSTAELEDEDTCG